MCQHSNFFALASTLTRSLFLIFFPSLSVDYTRAIPMICPYRHRSKCLHWLALIFLTRYLSVNVHVSFMYSLEYVCVHVCVCVGVSMCVSMCV